MARRPSASKRGKASGGIKPPKRSIAHWNLVTFKWFLDKHITLPDDLGPFVLEDHEETMLEDLFAGVPVNLWILPTGSRKSQLLAAIALFISTYIKAGDVFIIGGLAEHGKNCLDAAIDLVSRDKHLSAWWEPQEYLHGRLKSKIRGDRSKIVVVSAGRRVGGRGGSPVEGKVPVAILVEELHRAEDGGTAVSTLLSKAQKKSVGGWIVPCAIVTTAGDDMRHYLGQLIKQATDVDSGAKVQVGGRGDEYYRRGEDFDGDLVMHEWAVPEEIQPPEPPASGDGEELTRWRAERDAYLVHVKRANPCSFRTIKHLRQTFMRMRATPWVFQRQTANQWVVQTQAALDRVGWARGRKRAEELVAEMDLKVSIDGKLVPGFTIPTGTKGVVIGLDTSAKWDATAIVPVWLDRTSGEVWVGKHHILIPEGKTSNVRKKNVFKLIDGMRECWPGAVLAFDENYGGGLIAEQLEEDHAMVTVNVGTGRPFELASMRMAELISDAKILHSGDEEMTAHVTRAAARRRAGSGDYWRLDKPPDGDRIDGVAAMANAVHIAFNPPETKPAFDPDDYRATQL